MSGTQFPARAGSGAIQALVAESRGFLQTGSGRMPWVLSKNRSLASSGPIR